jgi:hypothetical protein
MKSPRISHDSQTENLAGQKLPDAKREDIDRSISSREMQPVRRSLVSPIAVYYPLPTTHYALRTTDYSPSPGIAMRPR